MPQQRLTLPQLWVLTIAFLTLVIPLLILEYPLLQYSKGTFVYPLDEAYIRMATARNLAFHESWSLSGRGFNSASSSILYPVLLAAVYKLFGTHLIFPFLINLFAGLICIVVVQRWLFRHGLTAFSQMLILAAMILLTPFPVLVAEGMEHMLQVLFTIVFFIRFCGWLATEERRQSERHALPWDIYLIGMMMTAIRYEGLFAVVVAFLALLIKRRLLLCMGFGFVSVLPVVIFGIYSLHHGAYFLPTSLMIKAIPIPLNGETMGKFFTNDFFIRIFYPYNTHGAIAATRLLIVLPLLYWLFLDQMQRQSMYRNLLLFALSLTILHLAFVNVVLFFRYEAYLIACTALIAGMLIAKKEKIRWPHDGSAARPVAVWTCIILLYPFFSRSWMAYKECGTACMNTYEQSYQAAVFLHLFYNNDAVVTEDIGTAGYLSNGKKIDLTTGIGYIEIGRSRIESYDRAEYTGYLVSQEKPALAIVSENRYGHGLLHNWIKVADWYTNNTTVLRDTHISFYAPDQGSAPSLRDKLKTYEPLLPAAVKTVYQ